MFADLNDVPGAKLSASAGLVLSIYAHVLDRQECLNLGAAVDQPGELQQLAESDHRTLNLNVVHRRPSYRVEQDIMPGSEPRCLHRLTEPGRVSRRLRIEDDLSSGQENLQRCQEDGSIHGS